MTVHVAMNIPAKDKMYEQARRVVKPGGIFAVYDVLQGEGGDVLFPVPWAREPSISHLATPKEMTTLLEFAGFRILDAHDSTKESQSWFEAKTARMAESGPAPITFQAFLGGDYPEMARNQVRNLTERRIRTLTIRAAVEAWLRNPSRSSTPWIFSSNAPWLSTVPGPYGSGGKVGRNVCKNFWNGCAWPKERPRESRTSSRS